MSGRFLLALVAASAAGSALLALRRPTDAEAQPVRKFKHVVVVFQENRTPDNLFQGLCQPPFGTVSSCSTSPAPGQYNIQTTNWLDSTRTVQPRSVPLAGQYDLGHGHKDWVAMCDRSGNTCRMDHAAATRCGPAKVFKALCQTTPPPQFRYVDNSTGILNSYLQLARDFGWANLMFQTNQGPSYPAHQFIFGGTSAPDSVDGSGGDAARNGPRRPGPTKTSLLLNG